MAALGLQEPGCSSIEAESDGNVASDKAEFVLTVLHEVVKEVLQNLPAQTLNSCARVCKRWKAIVEKIKKARQKHMWLLYDGDNKDLDIHNQIGEQFPELPSEPQTALLFCSYNLYEMTVSVPSKSVAGNTLYPRAAKLEKVKAVDYLQRVLPPNCQITGIIADGIVGTSGDLKIVREMEGVVGASCLFFPQIQGLDIYTFYAGNHLEEKMEGTTEAGRSPSPTALALQEITGIPPDKKPRVILLFHTEHFYYINADIGYALLKHYKNVVVAGGYVDNLLPEDDEDRDSDSESEETILMGVAFCGENIKMASVVLRSSVRTPKDAENAILKLKRANIPDKNTIGFMFACIGRGHSYYNGQVNVEADAFHKVFPKTPLFGFFGNGEVGFDYLPDYSKPDVEENYAVLSQYPSEEGYVWDLPEIHHSYTTIFVLMSVGSRN